MTILYFTTTGNSLDAARRLGGETLSIVSLLARGVTEVTDTEAIGLVCPVYFGKIPAPVSRFLHHAHLKAPYTFAILTCGSTPALAVPDLMNITWFDYVMPLLTVDNYFPMFNVEKQVRTIGRKHVGRQLSRIAADIASRRAFHQPPTLFGRIAAWWMRLFPLSPQAYKRFHIDESRCTQCGVCSQVCPIDNITYTPYPEIGERCLTCGACRHNCPSNAIRYRGEKSQYQYRNPHVTLPDIIHTNTP
ncbi:MAG: EFR1 family ferrodoxin [Muribaculaceae bacterium]|nr:EFR1 family ferrodoxin [Muribaculaceae bacterium]